MGLISFWATLVHTVLKSLHCNPLLTCTFLQREKGTFLGRRALCPIIVSHWLEEWQSHSGLLLNIIDEGMSEWIYHKEIMETPVQSSSSREEK